MSRDTNPTSQEGHRGEFGKRNPAKGIMVLLPGGTTHRDTFDLRRDAPVENWGKFWPIATKVPGFPPGDRSEKWT
jgi:hypothetical protein